MRNQKAANRYASSLLDLAIEKGTLEQAKADMSLIRSVISENNDLDLLLHSPIIKPSKKVQILKSIFAGSISEMSMSFIGILANNGRENLLDGITAQFLEQYREHMGIVTARVVTAQPLTEDLRKQVIEVIKAGEGKQVELDEHVDKAIIGGIVIKVGDKQIDASIAHKIHEIKRELTGK